MLLKLLGSSRYGTLNYKSLYAHLSSILEEDISFALVFVKRILLPIAAKVHASARLFHFGQVILPTAIKRSNDEIAFEADKGFLLFKLFALIISFVDLSENKSGR